jgi:hypothetical protein
MFNALLIASLLVTSQAPPAKPAPPATKPPETREPVKAAVEKKIKLFDGKTLNGWKPYAKEGDATKTWSVKDGAIHCEGTPNGYLATEKEYTSFELTLEWRFDPAKGDGNSGVLLRVQQPDDVWPKSIEAQLQSKSAGDIWRIGEFPIKPEPSRTEGRHTTKEHETNEKPLGEWNRYRIVLNGGRLELYVNDALQNVATDVEVKPGRIALQSEGSHIEFRNIELKPL